MGAIYIHDHLILINLRQDSTQSYGLTLTWSYGLTWFE